MYPTTLASVLLYASTSVAIVIGSAKNFGACAGQTVTSTGNTVVIGSVGTSPGTSITGFPPGIATSLNSGNVAAANCIADISTAYRACKAAIVTQVLTGQPLDGKVLTPGTYSYATTAALNAGKTLTFDALGLSTAQFAIQVGTKLDLFSNSKIVLTRGAKACNVFFCSGTSVVIGANAGVNATVIAYTSISAADAITNKGGLFGINGAVTMINDKITSCA
ncbi:MAG: hypothetical protein Q9217_006619 [Psora testacea]